MKAELLSLDEAQRRVVDHDGGPLLVLGSPGTGKTTVLVERWVRLATELGEPHRILLLVPTRERALGLRDELPWRLPAEAIVEVPAHTWHALAYHLVTRYYRKLGYAQPPIRLTTAEQSAVVRELLETEKPSAWGPYRDHLLADAFVAEVADFCVRAGHRGLDDQDLEALGDSRPEHAAVTAFALRYRAHLRSQSALDYAELVLAATRLLTADDDIRSAVTRRFSHVLVDDAQELAPAQLHLLRRLNTEHLVCAGDPDSAIEAFRGADPGWLERFETVAPSHRRISLETCHRYGKSIGDVAASLIAHSPDPGPHRVGSFAGPEDGTVELRTYSTMAGELEAVAREIRRAHLMNDVPYDRMAILLAQPSTYGFTVERVLRGFGVPARTVSTEGLRTQPAVRAVLDLCRLALFDDPSDDLTKAVLCSPLLGLHPYRVRELDREARMRRGTTLGELIEELDDDDLAELRRVRDAVRTDPSEPADATFARVFDTSAWCREQAANRRADQDAAAHVNALYALNKALAHFVERRPGATMREYLEMATDAAFAADTWQPPDAQHGVHLLSFHGAKGLEWDVVCVIGVAEGQIPKAHRAQGLFDPWALEAGGAIDRAQAQLAEERRTLYVALSRARRRLLVTTSPGVRKATPSRFCEEAFGVLPEPITPGADEPPLTIGEAAARFRRTLADAEATDDEKAAATAALARVSAHNGGLKPSSWWWRRDWTPGTPLYPQGKLTTSFSRISRYDECPLRYVLESVLGLDPQTTFQMKFGSLVHRIIERSDPVFGDITSWQQVVDIYKKEFVEHHRDDYPNDVFARTYYRYGVQSLRRWWNTERSTGETVEVEFPFHDLDFHGHTIRGRIDRVSRQGSGLVLSDYKTGRNPVAWEEAKESLQLAIYYRAAQLYESLSKHGAPVRMELIYPGVEYTNRETGSLECMKRKQYPNEAEEALGRLEGIMNDAVSEQFAPSPEADCRWCRMKPLCPRWPEGREVPR
ncbi:MAG TPA: ATP-dependent DNA helicase [Actinomycetota bacterium]|jgi:superfamily I DNA/RNA helicase/RecB family exonuclease|nr:ATP-dependent DNA helicase [Actinomycetota bacterium]